MEGGGGRYVGGCNAEEWEIVIVPISKENGDDDVLCSAHRKKMHYITNGINLFLPSIINLHVKDMHCHFARLVRPTQ